MPATARPLGRAQGVSPLIGLPPGAATGPRRPPRVPACGRRRDGRPVDTHGLAPDVVEQVEGLLRRATEADGVQPLSEHVWLHLRHGGEGRDENLLLHGRPARAPSSPATPTSTPPTRSPGPAPRSSSTPRIAAAGTAAARRGGAGGRSRAPAAALGARRPAGGARAGRVAGLTEVRRLEQLRGRCGCRCPPAPLPAGVRLRAFRPGDDDAAWLRLNAAAFAAPPRAGRVDGRGPARPDGRGLVRPGGLPARGGDGPDGPVVGFHWTKVHGGDAHGHGHEHARADDPGAHASPRCALTATDTSRSARCTSSGSTRPPGPGAGAGADGRGLRHLRDLGLDPGDALRRERQRARRRPLPPPRFHPLGHRRHVPAARRTRADADRRAGMTGHPGVGPSGMTTSTATDRAGTTPASRVATPRRRTRRARRGRVDGVRRGSDRFLDRELSWLAFNERVLELAEDPSVPLLERARFLAIFASNLDEFFMVRVAGLKRRIATGLAVTAASGLEPREVLEAISRRRARAAGRARGRLPRRGRARAGEDAGISVVRWDELPASRAGAAARVLPRPGLPGAHAARGRPGAPVPLHLGAVAQPRRVCATRDRQASTSPGSRCRRCCRGSSRSTATRTHRWRFVPLEDVIAAHLDQLFPGMEVLEHHTFRVTRNEDLEVEEDDAENLLQALEKELLRRRFGPPVRLEVADDIDPHVLDLLVRELDVAEGEVYTLPAPLDLRGLNLIADLDRPELHYPTFVPTTHRQLAEVESRKPSDMFAAIRERDVLLHHPYDSFSTSVQAFLEQAAADPHVLAIKQTLYRTQRRLPDRRRPDRRRRGRQAGARPRRDQGALRRAGQHLVGPQARAGRRARRLRHRRAQDARQAAPRRAPGGRAAASATATSAPATTTPRPPASTRTSGCSPATRRSATT